MTIEMDKLFNILKKKTPVIYNNASMPDELFFTLVLRKNNITLKITDHKGKYVEPGYEYYSGIERSILKEIESLREKDSFTIDWNFDADLNAEKESDDIILTGRDYLFSMLLEADKMDLDQAVLEKAGDIYSHLKQTGKIPGEFDILIAATAISNNLTLVTNNQKHYRPMEEHCGLKLDNWNKD